MRYLIACASLCCFVGGSYLRHGAAALSIGTQRNAQDLHREKGVAQESLLRTPPLLKLALHSPNGMQFFGNITIGRQTLSALYDTGSFDIITVSNLCEPCRVPADLPMYDNKTSGTFKKGNRPVTGHLFSGGALWARQDFETVHVGPADSTIKVEDAPFFQVVHTDMRLWTGNRSGFSTYVGLGHTRLVPGVPEEEEPMKSLLELSGTRRFAFCLEANSGQLIFNPNYDLRPSALMFQPVPVIGINHWAVEMKSISYRIGDHEEIRCTGDHTCAAIVDSGTSLIGLPPRHFEFMQKVSKKLKDDCNNLDLLPDLVLELGDRKFVLPPSAYVLRSTWDDKYCYPAFMDIGMTDSGRDVWILGVPFLRHFYTVFDRDGPSIHIAQKDDNCEPVPTPPAASGSFLLPMGLAKTKRGLIPAFADIKQASGPSWAREEKPFIL